ncbi:conserved hypothetical protein [Trichinella spiralis]|uniref:hypothetical protein n=1 Tax=Trichinella spiralis TaxID=6334 RepID=UPI0001EFC4AF|nr:conserved hypothetical protein [Trichinella spiralis]
MPVGRSSGPKWFSTLDFASGYWQAKVRSEDRPKAPFTTFMSCRSDCSTLLRLFDDIHDLLKDLNWKVALRNSTAPEHHTPPLLRTAPLYAFRHHILPSGQLCATTHLHICCFLPVNDWRYTFQSGIRLGVIDSCLKYSNKAATEPVTSLPSRSTASDTSSAVQDLPPSAELLGRNESSSLGPGPPETIPAPQG